MVKIRVHFGTMNMFKPIFPLIPLIVLAVVPVVASAQVGSSTTSSPASSKDLVSSGRNHINPQGVEGPGKSFYDSYSKTLDTFSAKSHSFDFPSTKEGSGRVEKDSGDPIYMAKLDPDPAPNPFYAMPFQATTSGTFSACDLNQDGVINILDVQLAADMYSGTDSCTATIDGPGVCNTTVFNIVQSAALGGTCHSVTLNWAASTTPGVSYNVYRSTTSGGGYTKLTSSVNALTYTDIAVQAGQTYYYVTTAVNSSGESAYSNQIAATIPTP